MDWSNQRGTSVVSTHSRAEAAACHNSTHIFRQLVSTHSRAEAAAWNAWSLTTISPSFNTQPRGGGCRIVWLFDSEKQSFNTQPRGGGCWSSKSQSFSCRRFNTQPRGGGCLNNWLVTCWVVVSTHSRAEAAAYVIQILSCTLWVSTHSRAEAAAPYIKK